MYLGLNNIEGARTTLAHSFDEVQYNFFFPRCRVSLFMINHSKRLSMAYDTLTVRFLSFSVMDKHIGIISKILIEKSGSDV